MITLVLNAAEGRVQFVLAEDGAEAPGSEKKGPVAPRVLCHMDLDAPSRGTELLPPALYGALQSLELTPNDIHRIACVHGPGSFTGIRLVLAFAAGIRRAVGCPVGGINYLHALAASVPQVPGLPARRRVLTHARRDLVHRQDFHAGPDGLVVVCEPELVELEQALQGLEGISALLLGSGYERNRPLLDPRLAGTAVLPWPGLDQPSARALVHLAHGADYAAADPQPLYLRPCDAVDNLPHIAGKRGEKAEDALRRLDALLERQPTPEA